MLNIPQLAQIKARDPYLYESLKQVVGAVNSIGRATGVDPSGSIGAPATIGGISVTAADGIFDLAITDNSAVRRGVFYFAESDTDPAFTQPHVYFLGSSRNLRVSLGNQTLYWRGYSQYIGSAPSTPVTFGAPPTAVTGGGAAGPAPQPSSGSGTATGQQGGSGFGVSLTQSVDDTLACAAATRAAMDGSNGTGTLECASSETVVILNGMAALQFRPAPAGRPPGSEESL